MSEPMSNPGPAEPSAPAADEQADEGRMVPVAEAIRYRRRAQQAEGKLQEIEQQLEASRSQIQQRDDELARAEAQRDEACTQLTVVENRLTAERMLSQAGVVDIDTASMLLSKRLELGEEVEPEAMARSVEQLLLDKPFLRGVATASLPPRTTGARDAAVSNGARLAQAAEAAATSGDRRDVANYLRLRRQASLA